MVNPTLICDSIEKSYGVAKVLDRVSISLEPGTATALAGENGAGKSTLMKIVAGLVDPDSGTVTINGVPVASGDPRAVRAVNAAMVTQELAPVLDMTVYENIYLGRELRDRFGLLKRTEMAQEAGRLFSDFGVYVNPQAHMRDLPVALRQVVEIVKAIATGANFIMLDEPTSALSENECQRLFEALARLKANGVSLLFTTHRMSDIRTLADRVVVLRDGQLTLDKDIADVSDEEVIDAMIGRELGSLYPKIASPGDQPALVVENLHIAGSELPISLSVRAGEILGLAGMVGAGRSELLEAIFGHRKSGEGTIAVRGKRVRRNNIPDSIAHGVALVPEDRKHDGLVLTMDVLNNASLPTLKQSSTFGIIRGGDRAGRVAEAMKQVRLKSSGLGQNVERLSGGNQQKVVLGRWLTGNVNVLLLDEPTRGVDVGARSEIYRLIASLAEAGMAVVMASSDMPEVLSLSHRVLVMREGGVVGEMQGEELTRADAQARVFHLASGYGAD